MLNFRSRKALTKTRAPVRFPERMPLLVKGIRTPAAGVTTSEPQAGNGLPGAPVTASMSGSAVQGNQGGTVEYCFLLYPTPDSSGDGLFFYPPPK